MARQSADKKGEKRERVAFEEIGIIEAVTLAFMAWLYISGQYAIAIGVAFFMGVGLAYLFDTHMSRIKNSEEYVYARKQGARRIMEEFGVVEIALVALTAASYIKGIWILGIVFSMGLGIALTYSIDRVRRMRGRPATS